MFKLIKFLNWDTCENVSDPYHFQEKENDMLHIPETKQQVKGQTLELREDAK